MKKFKLNFKSFLKENEIIFDFISKIIFGILSLALVINANKIASYQLSIQKENTVPVFSFEKTGKNGTVKISNDGGKIKNISIEKFDIIKLYFDKEIFEEKILYHNISQHSDRNNHWYFTPSQNITSIISFSNNVEEKLKKKYANHKIFLSFPNSIYKISYQDYQNNYVEEYFRDYKFSIMFKSTNANKNSEYLGNQYDNTIIATYDSEKELSEHFIQLLSSKIDYYLYKDKLNQ